MAYMTKALRWMDGLTNKMAFEWYKKIWEEDNSFFWDVAIVYGATLFVSFGWIVPNARFRRYSVPFGRKFLKYFEMGKPEKRWMEI
jgi:hypothetical protein